MPTPAQTRPALLNTAMATAVQANKGRFWGGDATDSDSDSSSGSESGKDDAAKKVEPKVQSRWAVESESESEDENRIARSVKDRTLDSLQGVIRAIANSLKINNWVGIQDGGWTAVQGGGRGGGWRVGAAALHVPLRVWARPHSRVCDSLPPTPSSPQTLKSWSRRTRRRGPW